MHTLKEIRIKEGLNQSFIASKIGVNIPQYSVLENGKAPLDIEDMVYLERFFNQPLDWANNERINPEAKVNIVKDIISLSQRYPLASVLNFVQKHIREGLKTNRPDTVINYYTGLASLLDEEPLLPPGI